MNIKGHIATAGICLLGVERLINMESEGRSDLKIIEIVKNFNLIPVFDSPWLIEFPSLFFLYNFILICSLILLGSSFPDIDTWVCQRLGLIKKGGDELQFAKYHRQLTHSLSLHTIILGCLIFFLYNEGQNDNETMKIVHYLYYFQIGVFTHLIGDVFVGGGGIPIGFTSHWKSSKRLSLRIVRNGKIVDTIVFYLYILSVIAYIYFYGVTITIIPILLMTLIGFTYTSSYKLFFTFLSIMLLNFFFFDDVAKLFF